jgi:dTMP kinase
MARTEYLGRGLPYTDISGLTGHLIVVEGPDGVGRTTQLTLLRSWLEVQGFGVIETGWTRSQLVRKTIDLAKEGNTMNALTFNLLYATDFADRLENEIIPALRSGFVVLADRYIYTAFARAVVRGADRDWIRSIYGFALQPDLVLHLRIDVDTLIHRVLLNDNLDHWEAGMDHSPTLDPFDSFIKYQGRIFKEYDLMSKEFGFSTIEAARSIEEIQKDLRAEITKQLDITPELGLEIPPPTPDDIA